jgi:hypothetical protein
MSKFQYELQEAIDDTMKGILQAGTPVEGDNSGVLVTIDNESMIDALNRRIRSIRGTLPPIAKRKNTVSQYVVPQSSLEELRTVFGIPAPTSPSETK